jgi:endonuclease/exonuclease/phosphatase family metal-dependent hydrolase
MPERPFTFHSVNVRRSVERTAALLHTNQSDFLLIQEPWYRAIGSSRSDSDPAGTSVKGFTSGADTWTILGPKPNPDVTPKVVIYARKAMLDECVVVNELTHPAADHRCIVLTVAHGHETIRVVNYYHNMVDNQSDLLPLVSSSLDQMVPAVVAGDFNTHSPTWSVPGRPSSVWADTLEEWFEAQALSTVSPPQVITRREDGNAHHAPSVLDLVLVNQAASWTDQFAFDAVSFERSLGSDHALLSFTWSLEFCTPDMDDLAAAPHWVVANLSRELWEDRFRSLPPCPQLVDAASCHATATRLTADLVETNDLFFDHARTPRARGFRWWNDACTGALRQLTDLPRGVERHHTFSLLRTTIRAAKHEWSEAVLIAATNDDKDLWAVAKWCKGRQVNIIPPLQSGSKGLVSGDHADMSTVLRWRFVPPTPIAVALDQPSDPAPVPPRPHHPITEDEV